VNKKYTFKEIANSKQPWFKAVYGDIAELNQDTLAFDSIDNYSKKIFEYQKKMFIYAEHLLFSGYLIYGKKFTLDDVCAIYTAMPEAFTDLNYDKYKVAINSFWYLNDFEASERDKRSCIKFYLKQKNELVKDIKMFKQSIDGLIIFNEPNFFSERINIYINLFENNNYTLDLIGELNKKRQEGEEENYNILGKYIEHRIIEKNNCGTEIYEKLNGALDTIDDEFLHVMGEHFVDNTNNTTIFKVNDGNVTPIGKLLKLQGNYTHIAGKTGTGKTVQTNIINKKLSETKNKILIITDTHANSKRCKNELDKLDITSTMLMGRNRSDYVKEFHEAMSQGYSELNGLQVIMDNEDFYENLDYSCNYSGNKIILDPKDGKFIHNCSTCKDANSYMTCGFNEMYRRIIESDIIIGTARTLLQSKAPKNLDKEHRTLFELCILISDIVIVDEVDEIQKQFDDTFYEKLKIYSSKSVDNKLQSGDVENYIRLINSIDRTHTVNIKKIAQFKSLVMKLDDTVDILVNMYLQEGKQDFVRDIIRVGNNFNIPSLIETYFHNYIKNKNDEEFHKNKFEFYRFLNNEDRLNSLYDDYFLRIKTVISTEFDVDEEQQSLQEVCIGVFKDFHDKIKNKALFELVSIQLKSIRAGKYKSKEHRENERILFFIFILLLSIIDLLYIQIKRLEIGIVGYAKNSEDEQLKQFISRALSVNDIPFLPTSLIDNSMNGYSLKDENNCLILNKIQYYGIGRELLFNTTKVLSVMYNTKIVPMLMASATSIDTQGSMYTVKHKANLLLENRKSSDSKSKKGNPGVVVKCHVFRDENGICTLSGTDFSNRDRNTIRLGKQVTSKLLIDLLEETKESGNGILITVSSSKLATLLYNTINIPYINKKMLWTKSFEEKFDNSIHIDKSNVERSSELGIDILIAVNKSIARGYNILKLDKNMKHIDKSYFQHIIIFNRYLPSVDDDSTTISYTHDYITRQYFKKVKSHGRDLVALRQRINKMLLKLKFQNSYKSYDDDVKSMIAGNMFADLSQIKGRGQRGGTTCFIHLVDASFYLGTARATERINVRQVLSSKNKELSDDLIEFDDKESIFQKFIDILNVDDILVDRLFDDMKNGFANHTVITHD